MKWHLLTYDRSLRAMVHVYLVQKEISRKANFFLSNENTFLNINNIKINMVVHLFNSASNSHSKKISKIALSRFYVIKLKGNYNIY